MAKIYSIEPVSFGFRPAAECSERDDAKGVYLRFRYGLIERLSVSPKADGFSVCYEAYQSFSGGGYSFSAVLNCNERPGDNDLAEVFLSILQTKLLTP